MIDTSAASAATPARAPFWRGLLSGSDNQTPAIGRVFGAVVGLLLVVDLLVGLPAVVCAVLLLQHVAPEVWFAFMSALTPYITAGSLAIGGLVGGLIAGTAFTEPKP
jgi:hypothetical protein